MNNVYNKFVHPFSPFCYFLCLTGRKLCTVFSCSGWFCAYYVRLIFLLIFLTFTQVLEDLRNRLFYGCSIAGECGSVNEFFFKIFGKMILGRTCRIMGLNYTKGNEPVSMKGFDKLPRCPAATGSFASGFLVCLCRR